MQQALGRPAVSDMACGKAEGDQAPEAIGQGMDLGGAATAADADGLDFDRAQVNRQALKNVVEMLAMSMRFQPGPFKRGAF